MSKKLIRFDWAIKTILRDKANFDILEGFLSALLEDDDIKILNLLESESNQEDDRDKFNRVDLLVEDKDKRKIFIEIQNTRESDYLERVLYGSSKIIVENQYLGKNFKDVSKVISISILFFNLGKGEDYIYFGTTKFEGMNTGETLIVKKKVETTNKYETKINFINKEIFPEYYLINVNKYQNIIKKNIDEWIYMMKNNEIKEDSKSRNINKAEKKLAELNMTKLERKKYERFVNNQVFEWNSLATAREEGMEKGRKEGMETINIEIAKKMLKDKEDIDKIIKYTKLTKEEIDKINCTHY